MTRKPKYCSMLILPALLLSAGVGLATYVDPSILEACPGYTATNVHTTRDGVTADLILRGTPCNVFGNDIANLSLSVVYETGAYQVIIFQSCIEGITVDRIHLKITDPSAPRYEVPESVLPRPEASHTIPSQSASIQFNFTTSPFSFSIYRTKTREILFTTSGHSLIFEPQYLRLKTQLGSNSGIYGLGEHTNSFQLPTENTTLTLWSRDAYGIPSGTNLYGNHPIYFEHRTTGTHGVFLLNSNGMDIKLTKDSAGIQSLEYNVIGGVLDMYFLSGSESDPTELARQYAEVVGVPAEVPYWSFGLHQCRFGYQSE